MDEALLESTQRQSAHLSSFINNKPKSGNYTYNTLELIGKGSFGCVFKAECIETKEIVAIKKVLQDMRYKNRELQMLKELNHPNVIKLRNFYYTPGDRTNEIDLNAVMDYIPDTLSRVVRQYHKNQREVPLILVKLYAFQLLKSINYIHSLNICHRDIKPQNVLVDVESNRLVLCDFGSAKKLVKGDSNVSYICSRFYRAPELIFNAVDYTNAVDVWSAGCCIAEMVHGHPVFPGESATDQIVEIIKVLGTPNRSEIHDMNPDYNIYRFPIIKAFSWSYIFRDKQNCDNNFIDLLQKLLVYSPKLRMKPLDALIHPFFDELREEDAVLPNDKPIPEHIFEFGKDEYGNDEEIYRKLVPSWKRNNNENYGATNGKIK